MRICGAWGRVHVQVTTQLLEFQSGADLWGVGTCAGRDDVGGTGGGVSIRCGFVGRGDSTPVCGGSELGKRGASRQPPARGGSEMVLTIMLEH